MFFRNIFYEIKRNLRTKEVLIWMILFPILLGTFYKFAFGNIGKEMEPVPVAVVENVEDKMFHMMYDLVNEKAKESANAASDESGDESADGDADKSSGGLLDATFCSEQEAYDKLNNGEIAGIVFINPLPGDDATDEAMDLDFLKEFVGSDWDQMKDYTQIRERFETMTLPDLDWDKVLHSMMDIYARETDVSIKTRKSGTAQSTLKAYIESFLAMKKMARDLWDSAISGNGTNMAIDNIQDLMQGATIKSIPLTDGNRDPFVMYMYNLIAMVSIFGTVVALHISINSQANLSTIGMRRSCSGTSKWKVILPELIGTYITHSACVLISITFLNFALQVNFGDKLPMVYLTGICGAVMGVSMGFFVGSIGRLSESAKSGIMMAVNMSLCFMSGLMVDSIRAVFAMNAPIVNDLNPVAIVCDAMYYLNMDADLSRYFGKLLIMGGYTVVFIVLGILMTRRKKYASL